MCASLSVMTSSSLAADGERASHQYPWMNFGTVEFDMTVQRDGKDEKAFLRFVVFKNGESLIESGRPGIRKRALQLPGSVSAYEGLASEDQIGISPKNPFMFIDMALAPILGPLTSAFPSGMEAVPRSGQPFSVARDNAQFKGARNEFRTTKFVFTSRWNWVMGRYTKSPSSMGPGDSPDPRLLRTTFP